jgi:acetyl esterase/lipase
VNDPYPFRRADIIVENGKSYAKDPTSNGCKDVRYSDENANCTGTQDCNHQSSALAYDLYYPSTAVYDYSCALPLVVYIHAGGFSDCSAIGSDSRVCTNFARKSFVCVNLEYRRGRELDTNDEIHTTVQQELAVYRACQDIRGFIRHIINKANYYTCKIDPNFYFSAGDSAGSVMALNAAYYPTDSVLGQGLNG